MKKFCMGVIIVMFIISCFEIGAAIPYLMWKDIDMGPYGYMKIPCQYEYEDKDGKIQITVEQEGEKRVILSSEIDKQIKLKESAGYSTGSQIRKYKIENTEDEVYALVTDDYMKLYGYPQDISYETLELMAESCVFK